MKELTHPQVQQLLARQAEVLSETEKAQVNAHLETCAACRAEVHALHELETRLRGGLHRRWDFVHTPNLHAAPALKYAKRKLMKQHTFRLLRFGAFMALLLLVLVASLNRFLANPSNPPEIPSPDTAPSTASPTQEASIPVTLPDAPEGWLVYTTSSGGGNTEIHLTNGAGTEHLNLTPEQSANYGPVWSPDGTRLAFVSNRNGDFQVYVMNANGTEVTQLTSLTQLSEISFCGSRVSREKIKIEGGYWGLSWAPDGETLVATLPMSIDGNMFGPLFLIHTDGAGVTQLTEGNDNRPHWSPDGQHILFYRLVDCDGGGHDLFRIRPDGTELTNLTNQPVLEASDHAWSPDSSKIAFLMTGVDQKGEKYSELRVMDGDGANVLTLYRESAPPKISYSGSLAWSPDGKTIAFVMPGDRSTYIHLIQADGLNKHVLTATADRYSALAWSSDGNWLVFDAGIDTPSLYSMDVRTAPSFSNTWIRLSLPGTQNFGGSWQPFLKEIQVGTAQVDLFSASTQTANWDPGTYKYTLREAQAKVDFVIKAPTRLPIGYFFVGTAWYGRDQIEIAFSNGNLPMSLSEAFVGEEEIEHATLDDYPYGTPTQEVALGEITGVYWQGRRLGGDSGFFDKELGENLRWQEDGLVYKLTTFGEPILGAEILASLARSMQMDTLIRPQLTSVHMFDEQNGWGIATNFTSGLLLHTRDGGKTWQNVTPEGVHYINAQFMLDAKVGFVFLAPENNFLPEGSKDNLLTENQLLRTMDGGESWQRFNTSLAMYPQFWFRTPNLGWAKEDRLCENGLGFCGFNLYQTHDSGETWTLLNLTDPLDPTRPFPLAPNQQIWFRDTTMAWVGGKTITSDLAFPLFVTYDNGQTWQEKQVPIIRHQASVAFTDGVTYSFPIILSDELIYQVATYRASEDGVSSFPVPALLVTRDGGETWALNPMPDSWNGEIDFVSPLEAFAICGNALCVSHDGAQTWETLASSLDFTLTDSHHINIDFVSSQIGWAVEYKPETEMRWYLYQTTDGGQTWQAISPVILPSAP